MQRLCCQSISNLCNPLSLVNMTGVCLIKSESGQVQQTTNRLGTHYRRVTKALIYTVHNNSCAYIQFASLNLISDPQEVLLSNAVLFISLRCHISPSNQVLCCVLLHCHKIINVKICGLQARTWFLINKRFWTCASHKKKNGTFHTKIKSSDVCSSLACLTKNSIFQPKI